MAANELKGEVEAKAVDFAAVEQHFLYGPIVICFGE